MKSDGNLLTERAGEMGQAKNKLMFSYKLGSGYRSIKASGAYGGIVSTGDIYMGIYSERSHLPETSYVNVSDDGVVLEDEVFRAPDGTVREIEVGLLMNLSTAKAYRKWLDDKIRAIEEANQKLRELK